MGHRDILDIPKIRWLWLDFQKMSNSHKNRTIRIIGSMV